MKKGNTISARYNFTLRAIRNQGFRVSAFNGNIFATHPDTKEILFQGDLEAAEKWILNNNEHHPIATPPEPTTTQKPGFWQGIVFAALSLAFSQIAIFGNFPGHSHFGPFAILFLFLAICGAKKMRKKENKF